MLLLLASEKSFGKCLKHISTPLYTFLLLLAPSQRFSFTFLFHFPPDNHITKHIIEENCSMFSIINLLQKAISFCRPSTVFFPFATVTLLFLSETRLLFSTLFQQNSFSLSLCECGFEFSYLSLFHSLTFMPF